MHPELEPHPPRRTRALLSVGIGALLIVAATAGFLLSRAHAARAPRALHLSDGAEAFFRGDTTVEPVPSYPEQREIHVDGDTFLRLPESASPWTVRTRLLVLTIDGGSTLRITAYSKHAGEQVEVVGGHVQARKAYPSPYADPDVLGPGEMVMINRTIDFMEKEHTNAGDVRRWGDGLIAETGSPK